MLLQHLKRGLLLGLLFLFSSSVFAIDYTWEHNLKPGVPFSSAVEACTDLYTFYGVSFHHFTFSGFTAACYKGVNDPFGQATRLGDSCPAGSSFDFVTGGCETDQLCEDRPSILSDSGTSNFSNNGCNYKECGFVADGDNGTYNILFCADSGYCADSLLGCDPDNPNPETQDLPNGCGSFGGKTVCMDSEDPQNCYSVDGVQQCFEKNSICGVKNGSMQCIEPDKDNCGSFNGDTVCFEPNSETPEVIDSDSPDDPDNGGNADGDETNDVADSRTTANGGDSTNQATDNNLSSKDKKQSKLDAQNIANEMLKKGMWEGIPSGDGITDGVSTAGDSVSDGLLEMGQGVVDGVVSGNDGFGQTSALNGLQNNVLSPISVGGSCSSIPIVIPSGYGTYYIDCFYLDKTREFLSFLFYVLTIVGLFYILTRPMEAK